MKAPALRPVLILALLVPATPTRAQGPANLAEIEEQIGAARFDEADAAIGAALASGKLDRRSLARAHLLAGVIASARRDEAAARASFRRALTLEPDAKLPPSAGPHVAAAFDRAREDLGEGAGLGVTASGAQARPGAPTTIDVRVTGDSERLARQLRVAAGAWRQERPVPPGAHAIEVPAPNAGCADVSAELVDQRNNQVWSAPSIARVCAAAARADAPRRVRSGDAEARPVGAPIWIGVALTGTGAVATSVLGIVALDQRSEYHDANTDPAWSESERQELRDEAEAAERRATIAAVATGVLAAATLTLYLLRPARSGTEISLRVAPGAAGATLGASF